MAPMAPTFMQQLIGFVGRLLQGVVLLIVFTGMPLLLLWAFSWGLAGFSQGYFYTENWVMPVLVLFSAFVGGVVIRFVGEKRGPFGDHLLFFVLGGISLMVFAVFLWVDMEALNLYTPLLARGLDASIKPYLLMSPGAGLFGLTYAHWFVPFRF